VTERVTCRFVAARLHLGDDLLHAGAFGQEDRHRVGLVHHRTQPLRLGELFLLFGEARLTLGHGLASPQERLAQLCDLLLERGERGAVAFHSRAKVRELALQRLDVL